MRADNVMLCDAAMRALLTVHDCAWRVAERLA